MTINAKDMFKTATLIISLFVLSMSTYAQTQQQRLKSNVRSLMQIAEMDIQQNIHHLSVHELQQLKQAIIFVSQVAKGRGAVIHNGGPQRLGSAGDIDIIAVIEASLKGQGSTTSKIEGFNQAVQLLRVSMLNRIQQVCSYTHNVYSKLDCIESELQKVRRSVVVSNLQAKDTIKALCHTQGNVYSQETCLENTIMATGKRAMINRLDSCSYGSTSSKVRCIMETL